MKLSNISNKKKKAKAIFRKKILRARRDPAFFIEFCLKHEKTNRKIKNAQCHRDWQDHYSTHDRVVLFACVEMGKSYQTAVGRVLWELGNDPNLRIALISDTAEQAEKQLKLIKLNIENNKLLRQIFPKLKPDFKFWRQNAISIKKEAFSKDFSVQAIGKYGAINGARLDLIIIDDICDFESTRTEVQRQKLIGYVDTTVLTRLTDRARIWIIGTPWHQADLLHNLGARKNFKSYKYPVVKNAHDSEQNWVSNFPDQWPLERILSRKDDLLPHAFSRKLLLEISSDVNGRFKIQWLLNMLIKGAKYPVIRSANQYGQCQYITGVDLAAGDKDSSAKTVLFTICILNNGDRLICEIQSGYWTSPEIINKLVDIKSRYNSVIAVESNATQKYLIQLANTINSQLDVQSHHTGKNKWDETFGVESLALEMSQNKWILPTNLNNINNNTPWEQILNQLPQSYKEFLLGCQNYSPSEHTDDHLMAAWIAREQ